MIYRNAALYKALQKYSQLWKFAFVVEIQI